jgi:hypothetical protein
MENANIFKTMNEIRDELINIYKPLLAKYVGQLVDYWKQYGMKDLADILINKKATLEDIISSEHYGLTTLDIWLLSEKFDLPVILFSATKFSENNQSILRVNPNIKLKFYLIQPHMRYSNNTRVKLIENNKKDNNTLKVALDELEKKLKETVDTNRNLEVNNQELKNTVNKYIAHNRKLDKEIKQSKNTSPKTSLDTDKINQINNRIDDRIKFYQDENIRLSSELSSFQKKYETISKNYNEVEFEKNSIFKQIQELNNSLNKTDFVDTSFSNENTEENSIKSQELYDIIDDDLNIIQKNIKSDKDKVKDKDKDIDLNTEITDIFN